MTNPKISVVTVVYNDQPHIEGTIKSVLSQTYHNVEYVVIDGGSSDGTVDVIRRYNDKLAYWTSEPDKGIYDAMNKAIDICTGDWIAFINSWDSFHDKDVLYNVFNSDVPSDVDVIFGDVCMVTAYGRLIKRFDKLDESVLAFNLCHQSTFTKASLLKRHKYDTSYKVAADVDFFNKIKNKENAIFFYMPIVVADYECGHGTSANSFWKKSKEYRRLQNIKTYSIKGVKLLLKDAVRYALFSLPFGLSETITKKRLLSLYEKENL